MCNELPGSINELPVGRVTAQFSEVARGGKFGLEKRLADGRGRQHVCWGCPMTIIVLPSGSTHENASNVFGWAHGRLHE